MRPHLVVLAPPVLDHDPRIDPVLEPLHAEALVAELPVEALRSHPFCHGLPGIDQARSRCSPRQASAGSLSTRTPARCPSAGSAVRPGRSRASPAPRSLARSGCCQPSSIAKHSRVYSSITVKHFSAGRWRRHRTRSRRPTPGSRPLREAAAAGAPPPVAVAFSAAPAAPLDARSDAHDPRSSRGLGVPGTPGCADIRSVGTGSRARASPLSPARRASPSSDS